MAYLIHNRDGNPSNFSRITNSESEKTEWLNKGMLVHEISENDFNDLKNNLKHAVSWDGTNVTYENNDPIEDVEHLNSIIKGLISNIEHILKSNYGVSMSHFEDYLAFLKTFDTSTVNFPIDSWEKYCSDNSITFQSLLIRP